MHKIYTYCLFVITTLYSLQILGQIPKDTLLNKSFKEIYHTYEELLKTDTLSAKKVLNTYISKAKKENDTLKIASGLFFNSKLYSGNTRIQYWDSIINITKQLQNKNYPADIYFRKAKYYLYKKRNIEKALNNLSEARKYATLTINSDLLYRIEYLIGIIKSEHLGEKEEAIAIFKKCAAYYKKKKNYNYTYRYLYALHVTAETFIALKQNDSATRYNTIGFAKSSKSIDPNEVLFKNFFSLCEGINQYEQKNYTATIDSITKALPKMIIINDKSNIIDSYFYLGKSYYHTNKKDKAIYFFKKTDSLLETLNTIPQYKHIKTYEYLKNHYKDEKDVKNQNKYLNKLNSILDSYINDKIYISTKVKEDYDIPVLLDEQKSVIKKLNKTNDTYTYGILTLILLLLISGSLLYYQFRKKQLYQKRFKELMNEQKVDSTNSPTISEINTTKDNKTLGVPEKHINHILTKLEEFEKEKGYLINGINSQSLAESIDTNVKYLSKVINHYKNKTFTTYLNELRITNAVYELKNNTTLRKYTIKAIAEEMGYNSAETFSNAFYKQIGIKPSFFINQIKKVKEATNN